MRQVTDSFCSKCDKVMQHGVKKAGAFTEEGIDRLIVALFTLGISEGERKLKSCCEGCGSEKAYN